MPGGGNSRPEPPKVGMEVDPREGPADRGQDEGDPHLEEEVRMVMEDRMVTEVRMEMATVVRTTMERLMTPGEPHHMTLGDQGETGVVVGAAGVVTAGTGTLSSFPIPTGTRMAMSMPRCSHRWSKVSNKWRITCKSGTSSNRGGRTLTETVASISAG